MRVLDLFSGRGGFCKPWADNGHEVVTLDNDTDGTFSSTHTTNISNFSPLDHYPVGHFDVILAGVPCTEYARWACGASIAHCKVWIRRQSDQKNELLNEFIRIRDELKPTYWVVENVRSSIHLFRSTWGVRVFALECGGSGLTPQGLRRFSARRR